MTDGSDCYNFIPSAFPVHHRVIHSKKQFAIPATGAHVNTAEAHSERSSNEPGWAFITVSPGITRSGISMNSPGDGTAENPWNRPGWIPRGGTQNTFVGSHFQLSR